MDSETLAHTKWNCKYHIVFAPKFRRQLIYGNIKSEVGKILRSLCKRKEIEIIEAELCPDHIHMLISIPPKYSVSQIMGYLKWKSSLMIFDKFAHMKVTPFPENILMLFYKYRPLWRSFVLSAVGATISYQF